MIDLNVAGFTLNELFAAVFLHGDGRPPDKADADAVCRAALRNLGFKRVQRRKGTAVRQVPLAAWLGQGCVQVVQAKWLFSAILLHQVAPSAPGAPSATTCHHLSYYTLCFRNWGYTEERCVQVVHLVHLVQK